MSKSELKRKAVQKALVIDSRQAGVLYHAINKIKTGLSLRGEENPDMKALYKALNDIDGGVYIKEGESK